MSPVLLHSALFLAAKANHSTSSSKLFSIWNQVLKKQYFTSKKAPSAQISKCILAVQLKFLDYWRKQFIGSIVIQSRSCTYSKNETKIQRFLSFVTTYRSGIMPTNRPNKISQGSYRKDNSGFFHPSAMFYKWRRLIKHNWSPEKLYAQSTCEAHHRTPVVEYAGDG